MTALVITQLTAAVQARAVEAIESRRQIAMLYEFAEVIASTTVQQELLDARGIHLSGAYLSFINLYGANPRGADLRKSDLGYADLRGARSKRRYAIPRTSRAPPMTVKHDMKTGAPCVTR